MTATVSRVKCLEECKRKYFFQYIEKIPVKQTEALSKGSKIHSLFENFENPNKDSEYFNVFENFKNSEIFKNFEEDILNGQREVQIGIKIENSKLIPCDYSDTSAVFRGKIDLLNENKIIDYKTGKYVSLVNQDWTQLEWYAIWLFLNSNYKEIKISYLYVEQNQVNTRVYLREELESLIKNFLERIKNQFAFERDPKNIPSRSWKCDYCQFREECDKDFIGDLDELF